MYSNVDELLEIAKFVFRDDRPAGKGQILDGATIRETLSPQWINGDDSGFGLTWEAQRSG